MNESQGPAQPRVVVFVGTRPEVIKMAPVARALSHAFDVAVVATGQHTDLFDLACREVCLEPDYSLYCTSGEVDVTVATVASQVGEWLRQHHGFPGIALVLVHGDTASAAGAALAAYGCGIPVCHVEAGLRSHDPHNPWPEEAMRRIIASLATLHLAPTWGAVSNLEREGVAGTVAYVGNPGLDTLRETLEDPDLDEVLLGVPPNPPFVIFSMHRRENRPMMAGVARAVALAAEEAECKVIALLHPSSAAAVEEGLQTVSPEGGDWIAWRNTGYRAVVRALESTRCRGVVTDSGGLVEEACAMGHPALVLRRATERRDLFNFGAFLAHEHAPLDVVHVKSAVISMFDGIVSDDRRLLADSHEPLLPTPYGRGYASGLIVDEVRKFLSPRAPRG